MCYNFLQRFFTKHDNKFPQSYSSSTSVPLKVLTWKIILKSTRLKSTITTWPDLYLLERNPAKLLQIQLPSQLPKFYWSQPDHQRIPYLKRPSKFLSISWLTFPNYSELILQDDLKTKLHEENSDFKATNRNEENTLFLDTIDTSSVFKRETSNTLDIITGTDTHEDDLNHLLFKTVQAQLKVQSTNTNNNSTNNAASSLSSLQPKKIQLIANNAEFGDFCNFLLAYCMKRKKISKKEEVKNLFYIFFQLNILGK